MTPSVKAGYEAIDIGLAHKDGVPWYDAPAPRRFHRCQVQTEGILGGPLGDLIQRCACGAIRRNNRSWIGRNKR